jgi:2,4-dienoyl-CoA reductase-like NADH-dependent reductase (Old Yellow Enzyme family)
MNLKIEKLLQSRTLASGINIKNPIVMAPMTTFSANTDGTVSDAELDYYKARSKNVGMVITATTYVSPSGKGFTGQFAAYDDYFLPGLKNLAETIKKEGALAILQIFHAGRMASTAEIPNGETISASAVAPERPGAITPREITEEEIEETIKAFGNTTKLAIEAGFDGVEIHGANTYLLQQFFSPHSNRRNDKWGGSVEKRMNFLLAVISEVKKVVKNNSKSNFVVGYRFSPEEAENPGITLDDTLLLLDVLAEQELSYLHVSLMDFWQSSIRDKENTKPIMCKILDQIHGRVPLIGVGSVHTPEEAIKALDSGVDFVALGREIIMEPEWLNKVQTNRVSEIRTTLSKQDREVLNIPESLWNAIVNTPGWLPIVE